MNSVFPLIIASFLLFCASARATTALVDFGRSSNSTVTYNNLSAPGALSLADPTGSPTGWTLTLVNCGTGTNPILAPASPLMDVSVVPDSISGYAFSAVSDGMFALSSDGIACAAISFTGLNPASVYDLLLFGSHSPAFLSPDMQQTWSLTNGTGGFAVSHSVLDGTTVVDWPGISPDSGGTISISVTGTAGTDGRLNINFASIMSVPEVSTVFMIGLSGLTLSFRRRR